MMTSLLVFTVLQTAVNHFWVARDWGGGKKIEVLAFNRESFAIIDKPFQCPARGIQFSDVGILQIVKGTTRFDQLLDLAVCEVHSKLRVPKKKK